MGLWPGTMIHQKNSSQHRKSQKQETSLKREINPLVDESLPTRLGEVFVKTHKLEDVCAKINRLSKCRDSIIDDRNFLKSPESQKILKTAKSMGWREQTYLANEMGVEKDIAQWPEDIQKILRPLFEKAKFGADDRVYGKGKPEVARDTAGETVEQKVEGDEKEPSAVIDLS